MRYVWYWILEIIHNIEYFILGLAGVFRTFSHTSDQNNENIVIVPGVLGNDLNLRKLKKKLIEEGYNVYFPPLHGGLQGALSRGRALEQYLESTNLKKCYIIAHSTGGFSAALLGYKGREKVEKLFAVNTPFGGTLLAIPCFIIPALRETIYGTRFLKNNDTGFKTNPVLQSIGSAIDQTIIPGFRGTIGRVDDIVLDIPGHMNAIMTTVGVDTITGILLNETRKGRTLKEANNKRTGTTKKESPKATGKKSKPVKSKEKTQPKKTGTKSNKTEINKSKPKKKTTGKKAAPGKTKTAPVAKDKKTTKTQQPTVRNAKKSVKPPEKTKKVTTKKTKTKKR